MHVETGRVAPGVQGDETAAFGQGSGHGPDGRRAVGRQRLADHVRSQRTEQVLVREDLAYEELSGGVVVQRAHRRHAPGPTHAVPELQRLGARTADLKAMPEKQYRQPPGDGFVANVVHVGPDLDPAECVGVPVRPIDRFLGPHAYLGHVWMGDDVARSLSAGLLDGVAGVQSAGGRQIGQAEGQEVWIAPPTDLRRREAEQVVVPPGEPPPRGFVAVVVGHDDEVQADLDRGCNDVADRRRTVAEIAVNVHRSRVLSFSH